MLTRAPGSDEVLIQERLSEFFVADGEGKVQRKIALAAERPARPEFGFVPPAFLIGREEIIGLAMFRPKNGAATVAGVVRVAIDSDHWSGPLTTIPIDRPEFLAYTLAPRMLSAMEKGVALLVHGAQHEIREVVGETVRTIPVRLGGLDAFPTDLRPEAGAMGAVHQRLRDLRLPVGLATDRSQLFLLVAGPTADRKQRTWELFWIDAETGAAGRRLWLPTHAEEIALSPGADHWVLLEKSVSGIAGTQRSTGAVMIPTSWIHENDSPLSRSRLESEAQCSR